VPGARAGVEGDLAAQGAVATPALGLPVVLSGGRLLEGPSGRAVEADVAWPDSFRGAGAPNWDAVWLFAKWRRAGESRFRHAVLSADAAAHAAGADVALEVVPAADGRGAFVQRRDEGRGAVGAARVALAWPYAEGEQAGGPPPEVRLFGLPMVYVPEGGFALGDGVTLGRFHAGGDPGAPYQVTAGGVTLADAPGGLWADATPGALPTGGPSAPPWDAPAGELPAAYPTGFRPFYVMKYEVTQGLYAAFLSSLEPGAAARRAPAEADLAANRYRYTIAPGGPDGYAAAVPSYANNWMSAADDLAFADWAALRPMSEFEFEKACRGAGRPAVPGEYAWGSTRIVSVEAVEGDDGSGAEAPAPAEANTLFERTIAGPVRAGLFEGRGERDATGAGFYGALDLSGNVIEMTVTAGNGAGRAFTGEHGDGELDAAAAADAPGWPRPPENGGVVPNGGWGFRGGDFWNPELDLRVSARNVAAFATSRRLFGLGFRAARSAGR
jgi:formylglycine-generating enzyme required for sulfatase activity